jgi:pantoate--beta-alanine ligase
MFVQVVQTVKEVREFLRNVTSIGLVPTMGALHAGHEQLIKTARAECRVLVASIFVNPLQFGPSEDYTRYPRPLSEDLAICERDGVDLAFTPTVDEMYPQPQLTVVDVARLSEHLCGKFRPGHFRGVATVVLKLLNIVRPDRAYFGEKDMQQLMIIRRMTADLNLPIEIVGVPTVREPDGLALSSRNKYLSPEERKAAPSLHRALSEAARQIQAGETDVSRIRESALAVLKDYEQIRVEYFEIVDRDELQPVEAVHGRVRILAAIWIGATRLIDNVLVNASRSL